MTIKKSLIIAATVAAIFTAPAALAFKEYPAGEPVTMNGDGDRRRLSSAD